MPPNFLPVLLWFASIFKTHEKDQPKTISRLPFPQQYSIYVVILTYLPGIQALENFIYRYPGLRKL